MPDVQIDCVQCGTPFTFTEYDQSQYYQRNMTWPKRCKECRTPARAAGAAADDRPRFEIVCTNCGKADRVPFKPAPGRAVLCAECHGAQKARASRR
jgi:CxxC-x17-CxxC domain-containing protein